MKTGADLELMTISARLSIACALVLGSFVICHATGTDGIVSTNALVKIVSPQVSVDLPKLGHAIFREQASGFSLQVPIGFRENGNRTDTNRTDLQVWLLRTDGTVIPPLGNPSLIILDSTEYRFYEFSKVPADELSGVVASLNGKFYCREIEWSNHPPAAARNGGDIFQITPANIAESPISVRVTNWDSSERFTVFYKTDKTLDRFLDARLEVSDAGSIISSEPLRKVWATNGFKFEFNTGFVWPFKFKLIEAAHDGEKAMTGFSGYWFYLRNFDTNVSAIAPSVAAFEKTTRSVDGRVGSILMPDLGEPLAFNEQPTQFTLQITVDTSRDNEKHTVPKANELHRQAWLLRPDGTAIPQIQKPQVGGVGNGGFTSYYLVFTFPRKSTNEVGGIAVSVNGKLYCRELPSVWNTP